MRRLLSPLFALVLFCSCQGGKQAGPATIRGEPSPVAGEGKTSPLKLTSTIFTDGGLIPGKYTCDGANVSPPLAWEGVPAQAKSLALVCQDPDAPGGVWTHWALFDLPVSAGGLPENVPASEALAGGGRQGRNDFKKIGYGGPCPPHGTHRYFFRLYALDEEVSPVEGATAAELLKAMQGHIVAEGELMGKYER